MSVAPLTSAPSAPADSSSDKGLERLGKILSIVLPIFGILLSAVLGVSGWYSGQQSGKASFEAKFDTLVAERGKRNEETREMVVSLGAAFNKAEKENAEFRGRTDASLQAIKDAVATERADRRDDHVR